MKCETCRALMMGYLRDELDEATTEDIERHLEQCVECRKELQGTREVLNRVDAADEPGIRRLVDETITRGLEADASDIHIQPNARETCVRCRIDGVLHEVMQIPRQQHGAVLARAKQIAAMDLLEQQLPQDGRIAFDHEGQRTQMRVASLPTLQGESIVMRVLPPPEDLPTLDSVGVSDSNRQALEALLRAPTGLVVSAGPIGSGKTTTLHAMLRWFDEEKHSIATVEDPIHMVMDGVRQV